MINYPAPLVAGSAIGITCPSSFVSADRCAPAVSILEEWGFRVVMGNTVGREFNYFSGSDDDRRHDLQQMLDNPGIGAILMGRGGYGMSRIIDGLDFTRFSQRPKWICGFSDITVIHNHIQSVLGIPTLHSPMCGHFKRETMHEPFLQTFRAAITGAELIYNMEPSPYNRHGVATGVLTGGNLALLAHLTGSVSEVETAGKILFIEDVSEYKYNIDRMLLNLKRAGKLDRLQALVVGGFTDVQDTEKPFGEAVEEIILDKVKEYDYPVCFNFPCGHQDVNFTLTLGGIHQLSVSEHGVTMELCR